MVPEISDTACSGAKSGSRRLCLCKAAIEESFELKRTLFFLLLASVGAALTPLAAVGQTGQQPASGSQQTRTYKYEGYVGFAYTSLKQVNQSRYGLYGGKVMLMRDWGKYFGLMGTVDYYRQPISSRKPSNPGDPSVYSFTVGPEIHTSVYENLGVLLFAELGGEHTGGESMTPVISFAGGFGGGITYRLNDRLGIRIVGDRLGGSFSLSGNTPQLGYSTHLTWNPRATVGVTYRF